MEDNPLWNVTEDGSLALECGVSSVFYHHTLNVLLITTADHSLKVLDVPSGIILKTANLTEEQRDGLKCSFVPCLDRVVYTDGREIGIRKDLNGVLLFDTALQKSISRTEDKIGLELPLPEATHLFRAMLSAELAGVDSVEDVLRELEKGIEAAQQSSKLNHKLTKWATVCLRLPHCTLKGVFGGLVDELKRQHEKVPGLPVASAVYDRLGMLLSGSVTECAGVVDRTLMYSESARRQTFAKWPHMNYKWALPEQMAQAGFYHQPASTGDDRALCFTCNVCLVSWEPTDEPWSEHERHSPQCPFVKGEYTHNVPLTTSQSIEPAVSHGNDGDVVHIECVSTTSNRDLLASSSVHGNVVVWTVNPHLQKHMGFNIDPWDSTILSKTGWAVDLENARNECDRNRVRDCNSIDADCSSGCSSTSSTKSNSKSVQERSSTAELTKQTPEYSTSITVNVEKKNLAAIKNSHPKSSNCDKSGLAHGSIGTAAGTSSLDDGKVSSSLHKVGVNKGICTSSQSNGEEVVGGENLGCSDTKVVDKVSSSILGNSDGSHGNSTKSNNTDHNHHHNHHHHHHHHQSSCDNEEQCEKVGEVILSNGPILNTYGDDTESKAEVIEVGGAWKTTLELPPMGDNVVEIPLDDIEIVPDHPPKQWRPSQDVLVSSLCVLGESAEQPCLVSGVALRRSEAGINTDGLSSNSTTAATENEDNSEVQALNQVNQALNTPQIISDSLPSPFIPYLLVHDICPLKHDKDMTSGSTTQQEKTWKTNVTLKSKLTSVAGSMGWKVPHPVNLSSNVPPIPQLNINALGPPPVICSDDEDDKDYEDPDIQILSVTEPVIPGPVTSTYEDDRSTVFLGGQGHVMQCIALPSEVNSHHYVSSITPTPDARYLVVTISPRCLNRKIQLLSSMQGEECGSSSSSRADCDCSTTQAIEQNKTGFIYLYQVQHTSVGTSGGNIRLEEQPARTHKLSSAVKSVVMLPAEVGQQGDEDEIMVEKKADQQDEDMYMVVISHDGQVQVMRVCDLRVLTTISSPLPEAKFVAVTYCSGIDRLCCSTEDGRLYFYVVRPSSNTFSLENLNGTDTSRGAEDTLDGNAHQSEPNSTETFLVNHPLTLDSLSSLHGLTCYENLTAKFTSTAPPCWNEIQQEQQQRRHPQHLHRQVDGAQHTRTWRLLQDSTSWSEHVFELVLPRPTVVGHIDVKFQLEPMCITPPDIEVKLYKQNVSSFARKVEELNSQVDDKIDFKLPSEELEESKGLKNSCYQLKAENVEALCGPYDLSSHLDLSGHSGIITMTSPKLLKDRVKTLLIHIKALNVPLDKQPVKQKDDQLRPASVPTLSNTSNKGVSTKSTTITAKNAATLAGLSKAALKQKLTTSVGCDWINEISVSLRKNTRSSLPSPRMQRVAMLETCEFHEELVNLACLEASRNTGLEEHKQKLALDILGWILSMKANQKQKISEVQVLVSLIKSKLHYLVTSCYMDSGRSVAHKCTSLLSQCLEQIKHTDMASSFSVALLHSLLDCLPQVAKMYSAGSLKWYFTLLNRVKCVDINKTAELCADLLATVSRHYSQRICTWHSLLKARYGLYGNPLDPDLFDIDIPQQSKVTSYGSISYANMVGSQTTGVVGGTSGVGGATGGGVSAIGQDEVDDKDLLNMMGKGGLSSKLHTDLVTRHVFGLLEVEPLHYTCTASSDGTRIERIDVGQGHSTIGSHTSAFSGGTINFGENLVTSGGGTAMSSLSSAIGSAEQELHKLQQKQMQLIKLQQQKSKLEQKLAETSKNALPPVYQSWNAELFPPTPKNTPFFMTPPLTPPNESFMNKDPSNAGSKASSGEDTPLMKPSVLVPSNGTLFQLPPAQAVVIERMHSGARRFVVLDFGQPVMLTDILVPSCQDLASLSIDVWLQNEELDGQRLVISSDIGHKALVLNDLTAPPVCRYLKLTTIGKYGGSTTKSKIPIGHFYGHTFLLPWDVGGDVGGIAQQAQVFSQLSMYVSIQEDIQCRYSLACKRLQNLLSNVDDTAHTQYFLKRDKKADDDHHVMETYQDCTNLQQQLNVAQHAIQRLKKAVGLLSSDVLESSLLHQCSTDKLQMLSEMLLDTLLSMTYPSPSIPSLPPALYTVLTPVVCEDLFHHLCVRGTKKMQGRTGLLLVRMCGRQGWWGQFLGNMLQEYFVSEQPSIFPQDRVFVLLVSLAQRSLQGHQAGNILNSVLMMLAKLLSPLLYEQDNTYTPTTGSLDVTLIGWLLLFLSKCLDPITFPVLLERAVTKGSVKEFIVQNRWEFLAGESAVQGHKSAGKCSPSKLFKRKLQKRLMHHKQQLLDIQKTKTALDTQEKHLLDKAQTLLKDAGTSTQQIDMFSSHVKASKLESLLQQYSSKHFKDLMNMRRTEGELLRKLPSSESEGDPGGACSLENNGDSSMGTTTMMPERDRCIPVIRGLVALLLSMDFTCNVDLFVVACKVVARITQLSRPTLCLSEVMKQEELEKMIMLVCSVEYNGGNVVWGGVWASHAIMCLLQDILDGERLNPNSGNANPNALTDDDLKALAKAELVKRLREEQASKQDPTLSRVAGEMSGVNKTSETDESLMMSTTLPTLPTAEDDPNSTESSGPDISENAATATSQNAISGIGEELDIDKESNFLLEMLMDEDEEPLLEPVKFQEYLPPPQFSFNSNANMYKPPTFMGSTGFSFGDVGGGPVMPNIPNINVLKKTSSGTKNLGAQPNQNWWKVEVANAGKKLEGGKLTDYMTKGTVKGQGVSTAMDVRLERGLNLAPEIKLRLMITMEALRVHNTLTAQIPQPSVMVDNYRRPFHQATDDEQITEAILLDSVSQMQLQPTSLMLSQCFNSLFMQLPMQRVNLDSLLHMWLTVNDDVAFEDQGNLMFDSTRVPTVPLDKPAITSFLTALAWMPNFDVRTWVLSFQVLCMLCNQKLCDLPGVTKDSTTDQYLSTFIVTHTNFTDVIIKFLSNTTTSGTVLAAGKPQNQVGPTVTKMFGDLLQRIRLRCPKEVYNNYKGLLLKLAYTLCSDRGAIQCGTGPLDAQCAFVDHLVDNSYDHVEPSSAISVIEVITRLVYHHIIHQDKMTCRSSSDNTISARSCFGGLFASMLRGNDNRTGNGDTNRDGLVCNLLKLVNNLVQIPAPSLIRTSASRQTTSNVTQSDTNTPAQQTSMPVSGAPPQLVDTPQGGPVVTHPTGEQVDSPLTDLSKITQALGSSAVMTSTPNEQVPKSDDEKGQETDEQKTENTVTAATAAKNKPKSCSHYSNVRFAPSEKKNPRLADLVLGHYQTMMHLIQALGACNSSTMAMILGSSGMQPNIQDTFTGLDPISVGDCVFQILCSLNRRATNISLILKPLYDYLACGTMGKSFKF